MRTDFRRFCSPSPLQREILCYSDGMGFEASPCFFIDRRSFNNYLVMATVEGRLWCRQHGENIAVEPGEYILLDLHEAHKYYFEDGLPSRIAWAHLNGQPVARLVREIGRLSPLPLKAADAGMVPRLTELFALADQPEPDDFALSCRTYELLSGILRSQVLGRSDWTDGAGEAEFKKAAWHAIMHGLHRKITADDLAREMCLSKYHFIRRFHAAFGQPPMCFITGERIRLAKYLLTSTADPVSTIAGQLGFASSSYFDKTFRAYTGQSPSDYRRAGEAGGGTE